MSKKAIATVLNVLFVANSTQIAWAKRTEAGKEKAQSCPVNLRTFLATIRENFPVKPSVIPDSADRELTRDFGSTEEIRGLLQGVEARLNMKASASLVEKETRVLDGEIEIEFASLNPENLETLQKDQMKVIKDLRKIFEGAPNGPGRKATHAVLLSRLEKWLEDHPEQFEKFVKDHEALVRSPEFTHFDLLNGLMSAYIEKESTIKGEEIKDFRDRLAHTLSLVSRAKVTRWLVKRVPRRLGNKVIDWGVIGAAGAGVGWFFGFRLKLVKVDEKKGGKGKSSSSKDVAKEREEKSVEAQTRTWLAQLNALNLRYESLLTSNPAIFNWPAFEQGFLALADSLAEIHKNSGKAFGALDKEMSAEVESFIKSEKEVYKEALSSPDQMTEDGGVSLALLMARRQFAHLYLENFIKHAKKKGGSSGTAPDLRVLKDGAAYDREFLSLSQDFAKHLSEALKLLNDEADSAENPPGASSTQAPTRVPASSPQLSPDSPVLLKFPRPHRENLI